MTTDLIPITPTSSIEQIADNLGKLKALAERARELKKQFDEQLLEYIEANGDVTIGEVRYYAGYEKETKCVNVAGAMLALLHEVGGDMEVACSHLSSSPLKHGAVKKVLPPEMYDQFFVTSLKPDLKEGKPVKKVLAVKPEFVK
jgi:hypothetical protein